jgi:hypothetical protein
MASVVSIINALTHTARAVGYLLSDGGGEESTDAGSSVQAEASASAARRDGSCCNGERPAPAKRRSHRVLPFVPHKAR